MKREELKGVLNTLVTDQIRRREEYKKEILKDYVKSVLSEISDKFDEVLKSNPYKNVIEVTLNELNSKNKIATKCVAKELIYNWKTVGEILDEIAAENKEFIECIFIRSLMNKRGKLGIGIKIVFRQNR